MKIETQKKIIRYIPIVNMLVTLICLSRLSIKDTYSAFMLFLKLLFLSLIYTFFVKGIPFSTSTDYEWLTTVMNWLEDYLYCYFVSCHFIREQERILDETDE